MKLLGYKGRSLVSRAIQLQTRSEYSHIGIMLRDGSVVEAWLTGVFSGKVRHIDHPLDGHKPGTAIDVFEIKDPFNHEAAEAYVLECVGQAYDTKNVFRFVSRRQAVSNVMKFCSELAALGCVEGGRRLLRGNPSVFSPRDVCMSTELEEPYPYR